MKKQILAMMVVVSMVVFVGCGQKTDENSTDVQAVEDDTASEGLSEELEDASEEEIIPNNSFEEAVNKVEFDSYDEIVSELPVGYGYAYVDILGADEPILVIADTTYDDGNGNQVTTTAYPYLLNTAGKYICGSLFPSGDKSYPVALTEDGLVITVGDYDVTAYCLCRDYTDQAVMAMYAAYEEFDSDGNARYGGFVRTENTLIDNDGTEITEDDEATYLELYNRYSSAEPIIFTTVE